MSANKIRINVFLDPFNKKPYPIGRYKAKYEKFYRNLGQPIKKSCRIHLKHSKHIDLEPFWSHQIMISGEYSFVTINNSPVPAIEITEIEGLSEQGDENHLILDVQVINQHSENLYLCAVHRRNMANTSILVRTKEYLAPGDYYRVNGPFHTWYNPMTQHKSEIRASSIELLFHAKEAAVEIKTILSSLDLYPFSPYGKIHDLLRDEFNFYSNDVNIIFNTLRRIAEVY